MLWIVLWLLSLLYGCRKRKVVLTHASPAVPTGSVRWIDLVESRIVKRVTTMRPISICVWPGRRINLALSLTDTANDAAGAGAGGALVEVDMSDGSVECRQDRGVSALSAQHCIHGVSGISRGGAEETHIILAFFRGGKVSSSSKDLTAFLNARKHARLFFEDVASLTIAHGLMAPFDEAPKLLHIVLADLSERTFGEGQVVAW